MNCYSVTGFDYFNRLMMQTLSPMILCVLMIPVVWASRQNWTNISKKSMRGVKVVPDNTNSSHEAGLELPPQLGPEAVQRGSGDSPAGEEVTEENVANDDESFLDRYLALVLYITYLVLPSVTTTIFSAFPYLNANPSNIQGLPFPSVFLAADYSIVYDSPRYWYGVFWAVVMIFIFPVGIPLLYLLVLYKHRVMIQEYKKLKKGVRVYFSFCIHILF